MIIGCRSYTGWLLTVNEDVMSRFLFLETSHQIVVVGTQEDLVVLCRLLNNFYNNSSANSFSSLSECES